jgi:hypothetical protein
MIVLTASAATRSQAGTVNLHGIADGDSTYVETWSDGFYRMDLYDPPPRETQQRFHSIQDPTVTYGNLAYDGFPNDEQFRLGSVTYDDADLVGGNGVATVTAIALGVDADPNDAAYRNYARWNNLLTFVDDFAGTVTVVGGVVTSIDLEADVHLEFTLGATVVVPGAFTVSGKRFKGFMQAPFPTAPDTITYDFGGELTTVFDPEYPIGDYNRDTFVDAADYATWKAEYGGTATPAGAGADGNGDGAIDAVDYTVWRNNLPAGSGALGALTQAPEPPSAVLAAFVAAAITMRVRSRLAHRCGNS